MTANGVEMLDGRRLRRVGNREAVIDALLELFRSGVYQPTAAQVAGQAGLSLRSLFRYFDDVDDLRGAAIERHLATMQAWLDIDVAPGDPLDVRIGRFVTGRIRLFEAVAPTARAARAVAHRQDVVAAQMAEARKRLRQQVRELFAPELAGSRADLLGAVDALTSFESYELMRHDQRLSQARTKAVLVRALTALLITSGGPT